jgi:NADPH2:quinone reductase
MRAVWYEAKGPAGDVLIVGEMPDPIPAPGEVRVRVAVSGVNPTDTKSRSGFGGNPEMPFRRIVPGQDGAGTIDRVGPGVDTARIGERVWVYEAYKNRPFGTAAEFVTVAADNAVPLPPAIDFDTGAGVGIPAMTAHRCLFVDGSILGKTILVSGGGGSVGYAAIQLAVWAGARVLATVSRPDQAELARAAGAWLAIDRKNDDVAAAIDDATHGAGVDRVVEVAFEENLDLDRRVLASNGTIATYASGPADSAPNVPASAFMRKGISIQFVLVYAMPAEAHRVAARDITAALEAGRLRTHVGARFPLARLADAHDAQDSGNVVGKILVDVPG